MSNDLHKVYQLVSKSEFYNISKEKQIYLISEGGVFWLSYLFRKHDYISVGLEKEKIYDKCEIDSKKQDFKIRDIANFIDAFASTRMILLKPAKSAMATSRVIRLT